ncbi:hypothetical protein [Dehalobacterium formicoaceticum]|uniref:hypothetical protein n=1 Tax=Dehalobacterium formicoaceticum TaxID=51515 RepID=UPI000B7FEA51|nr:hypothetical protein [Dehalobacterium formicoaceticum]
MKSATFQAKDDIRLDSFLKVKPNLLVRVPIIVIYNNPADYPGKFVARLWDVNKPTRYAVVKDTLEEARKAIPYFMWRIGRDEKDDPVIVEIWM